MSNFCPKCDRFIYPNPTCHCVSYRYQYLQENEKADNLSWNTMYGVTPEEVATKAGENYYHDDPCNPDDFDVIVAVQDGRGIIAKFKITAEATVDFNAEEIEE